MINTSRKQLFQVEFGWIKQGKCPLGRQWLFPYSCSFRSYYETNISDSSELIRASVTSLQMMLLVTIFYSARQICPLPYIFRHQDCKFSMCDFTHRLQISLKHQVIQILQPGVLLQQKCSKNCLLLGTEEGQLVCSNLQSFILCQDKQCVIQLSDTSLATFSNK